MDFALDLALFALTLLMIMMLARIVLSWVFAYARDWHPRGLSALAVESVYATTDPLIKPIRRVIPPVTMGSFRFDVAFMIVFFTIVALQYFLSALRGQL